LSRFELTNSAIRNISTVNKNHWGEFVMANDGSAAAASLQARMNAAGGAINLLRSAPLGRYVFPKIPPEFSNFRDEARAWKTGAAMLEQSYHMCELHLRGPQVLDLLAEISVNKLSKFPVLTAKQLVLAGHDGNYIADAIIFHEEEDFYRIVGAPFASDWVQFNAALGKFDVEADIDLPLSVRDGDRTIYRLQLQGRHAMDVMNRLTNGNVPDPKFFHIAETTIAGRKVRALRHGMAGEPGFELYGPWEDQHIVRAAILEAGREFGLRKVGADAYSVTGIESGWMPMPLPAIYHGEAMRPYREWLTTNHLETIGSLGGSFVSDDIRDYYVDPLELGYSNIIDWNRDFLGRDALDRKRAGQHRVKRSLRWNQDDVAAIMHDSLFPGGGLPPRYIAVPSPMYATFQADCVMAGGNLVGLSQWSAYSANAEAFLSLALVDRDFAEPGTEVTLLWGEPNSQRPSVDRHEVREIRATVEAAPYFNKVIKTG
jgi:vanillate/3-O-methylgallate O-demethylase